jgi:hypothetical protein
MKYEFIPAHRTLWPIAIPCRTLSVSRSGDDAWLRRAVCESARRRNQLTSQIQVLHATRHHDVYGAS